MDRFRESGQPAIPTLGQVFLVAIGLIGVVWPLARQVGPVALLAALAAAALWLVAPSPFSYTFVQLTGGTLLGSASLPLVVVFQVGALLLLFAPLFGDSGSLRALLAGFLCYALLVAVVVSGAEAIGTWLIALLVPTVVTAGLYWFTRATTLDDTFTELT